MIGFKNEINSGIFCYYLKMSQEGFAFLRPTAPPKPLTAFIKPLRKISLNCRAVVIVLRISPDFVCSF